MKTKYYKLTLMHNLLGVISPTKHYEHIYKKGSYLIPPVITLYDDKIDKEATRTEAHGSEGKLEARQNDVQLYKTANNSCKNIIMEVVDETWYKEIEDTDMFYTDITDLKLLDHLTEFWSGLHTINAVDIPQLMKTLSSDAEGISQFINAMEVAQRKSKLAKLVIHDEYMHTMALEFLLQPDEYKTETQEWSKIPED